MLKELTTVQMVYLAGPRNLMMISTISMKKTTKNSKTGSINFTDSYT
jgi:hypothetical protein